MRLVDFWEDANFLILQLFVYKKTSFLHSGLYIPTELSL